jgi:hypothetical protein
MENYSPDKLGGIGGAQIDFGPSTQTTTTTTNERTDGILFT